jgi:hypothetical protein
LAERNARLHALTPSLTCALCAPHTNTSTPTLVHARARTVTHTHTHPLITVPVITCPPVLTCTDVRGRRVGARGRPASVPPVLRHADRQIQEARRHAAHRYARSLQAVQAFAVRDPCTKSRRQALPSIFRMTWRCVPCLTKQRWYSTACSCQKSAVPGRYAVPFSRRHGPAPAMAAVAQVRGVCMYSTEQRSRVCAMCTRHAYTPSLSSHCVCARASQRLSCHSVHPIAPRLYCAHCVCACVHVFVCVRVCVCVYTCVRAGRTGAANEVVAVRQTRLAHPIGTAVSAAALTKPLGDKYR